MILWRKITNLINSYDTTMYATTMYLVLIKISTFLCFPSVQPVLFTLVNYVKVVQWPRYTEARILYSYALNKNDITWSNLFTQNWMLILLLMSYEEKHLQIWLLTYNIWEEWVNTLAAFYILIKSIYILPVKRNVMMAWLFKNCILYSELKQEISHLVEIEFEINFWWKGVFRNILQKRLKMMTAEHK